MRARIEIRLDVAGLGSRASDEGFFCVSVVLEREAGFPLAHHRTLAVPGLSAAASWAYTAEVELPADALQILVLVEELASRRSGVALVEEATHPIPPADARHTRLATDAWFLLQPAAGAEPRRGSVIRLIPPRRASVAGTTRFETLASAAAIDRVVYYLDGEEVDVDRRRPFVGRLPLDEPSRPQIVRAVALDASGRELGEDRLTVNLPRAPFRVAIVELRQDPHGPSIELRAEVAVPPGTALERVEIYRNETLVGTLTDAEVRATLPGGPAGPEEYVRIAAVLADGRTAEDVRLLAAGAVTEEVEVNLVQAYVVALDAEGRPVRDLVADEVTVIQSGERRQVDRFQLAEEVPLTLGVVIDTSGSMRLIIDATRQAAAKFLAAALRPRDRAFLVDFAERPRLLHGTTEDLAELLFTLERLKAEGATALYDAAMFSVLQLEPSPRRKAVVLLTDGDDRDSRFGPGACVEVARKAGVAVYLIGLGGLDHLARFYSKGELRRLTEGTGGRLYFIDAIEELDAAYAEIGAELRSQYFLTFYADRDLTEDERQQVVVRVDRPGVTTRTVVDPSLALP